MVKKIYLFYMERYNKIYPNRKSARMLAKIFRQTTGKRIDPKFVHWLAAKKGFKKYYYGNEVYYASNLYTTLYTNYFNMYPIFLKEMEQGKVKKKATVVDYNPDAWIEGDRNPRFYSLADEDRIIRKAIFESINNFIRYDSVR